LVSGDLPNKNKELSMDGKKENYQYHGYCTARVDDQKKCVNFELVDKTNGLCKFVALGGACDFSKELKRTAFRGWRE